MKKMIFYNLLLAAMVMAGCDDSEEEPTRELNIDLAVHSLEFEIEKTQEFVGIVTITGIIKNIGDDFRSSEGQQAVHLLEKPAGSGKSIMLDMLEFTDLDAGETLEVSFQREWYAGMEFPPSFIVRLSYDPDIYIDGNEQNDDSNTDNNAIERSGQEISEMF